MLDSACSHLLSAPTVHVLQFWLLIIKEGDLSIYGHHGGYLQASLGTEGRGDDSGPTAHFLRRTSIGKQGCAEVTGL